MKTAALLLIALASAFEVPPVIPESPVESVAPAGATFDPAAIVQHLPHWAQIGVALLALLGSIVGPSSIFANFLNNLVRAKRENGEKPSSMLLAVAATVNRTALNFGKGARLAKAAKE